MDDDNNILQNKDLILKKLWSIYLACFGFMLFSLLFILGDQARPYFLVQIINKDHKEQPTFSWGRIITDNLLKYFLLIWYIIYNIAYVSYGLLFAVFGSPVAEILEQGIIDTYCT